jgi:glycerol kinase
LGAGLYKDLEELSLLRKANQVFSPKALPGDVELALNGWRRAVNATIAFHAGDHPI